MSELFGRSISVHVGPPGQPGRAWKDLRIVFRVTKTTRREPNKASVQIYNVSADSAAYMREPGTILRLLAGYGIPGQIFLGDVDTAVRSPQVPDVVTTLEAQDGARKYRSARLDRSYAPGTSYQTVFRDLIDALGLPSGTLPRPPDITLTQGIVVQGYVRDVLDRLCQLLDAEWFIMDGSLQIMSATANAGQGPLISSRTGLIGSPEPYIDDKKRAGVYITTLLNDQLNPCVRFALESREYTGYYRVDEVEHVGDTHGGDWYSKVKARMFQ